MLTFFLIGFAAGALTGIPVGPVNVAVIDAAYRHTLRRAIAVAAGGAIADALYAILGVMGVTPVLKNNPTVTGILYAISGVILVAYGFLTARSRPIAPVHGDAARAEHPSREMWSGFTVGIALIALNPAALVTWVIIIGTIIPESNQGEGLVTAGGVLIGSFAWFALVAFLTHRGKHLLGEKAQWIPRVVGIALMGYGGFLLVKALLIAIR